MHRIARILQITLAHWTSHLDVNFFRTDSTHTGTVCAADKARRAAAKAASEEEAAGLARQWRNVERSLCSDRGLWAAPHKPEEAAWKLDKHEDSLRRCRTHTRMAALDDVVDLWTQGR